jgi:hypothetical protein
MQMSIEKGDQMKKLVFTEQSRQKLEDLLRTMKVSDEAASRLHRFMRELNVRLLRNHNYIRIQPHVRGLTYFPTANKSPKAFWINLAKNWFTIAYTELDGEHSKPVLENNFEEMLEFAEDLFNRAVGLS